MIKIPRYGDPQTPHKGPQLHETGEYVLYKDVQGLLNLRESHPRKCLCFFCLAVMDIEARWDEEWGVKKS